MPTICRLCPHACRLTEGKVGRCRQRTVRQGQLVPINYGQITAVAVDPIEKKPLYHFYPGTHVLSIGGLGCNLSCSFCQNYHIAHQQAQTVKMTPAQVVALALAEQRSDPKQIGIAFTYNEPTMDYEFVLDTARLAKDKGLKTALITNGYLQPEPWQALLQHIDALNIDVKAFTEEFYRELCGASLEPVLRNVALAYEQSHVELTYLVIPGKNDRPEEMARLADWVASLSPDIPLHLTRYFPNYKLKIAATPVSSLEQLRQVAAEKLNFVYLGNVGMHVDTYCPRCGQLVVQRDFVSVLTLGLEQGKCQNCGRKLPFCLS